MAMPQRDDVLIRTTADLERACVVAREEGGLALYTEFGGLKGSELVDIVSRLGLARGVPE